ncbi:DUF4241 domain-containing protein [Paenibacillus sp. OAS669]|uniref:DUF4241 domain-containing protein n=1 Tax=Paenibacillus sp. OAS669 TaxID=2663821 RepID=UPI00178B2218|nr:DUF4241 domain-containing protein [Paenibacillus sp. OAS669]MBE1445914.1 hypothetical protein [Paenibacillus sp. OAS669]
MNNRHQIVPLLQVKDKLPSDSLSYYVWIERRPERQEQEFVAYFSGDTTLESLDLDAPLGNEQISIILVDGNLTVNNYIYNENTDGAAGLIVIGHLSAKNILVGGQQIYVNGSLTVQELFWGDYNHGQLAVKGDVNATVFAETEEYHVEIAGSLNSRQHLKQYDEQWYLPGLDIVALEKWLVEELYAADEEECWLIRGSDVLQHLKAGKSLLKVQSEDSLLQPEDDLQKLRATVTVQAIEEILALPLVQEKYNDYYDMDKDGYWYLNLFLGFRLPKPGLSARVVIGEEIVNEDGEDDLFFFHYDIAVDEQGDKTVALYYQEGNGHEKELKPLPPDDTNMLKKALRHFKRLVAKVRADNKQYVKEKDRQIAESDAFRIKKEQFMKDLAEQEDLVDRTCTLLGHTFRVITVKQADRILNAIVHPAHNTPLYDIFGSALLHLNDKHPVYYLLSKENAHLQRLDMKQLAEEAERLHVSIAGYIFAANVVVDTYITAYDIDHSPPMVVFGDLTAKHIALFGASFYVSGNVSCECLYGDYNHGQLIVAGRLEADAVIANDFVMHIGTIGSNVLISHNNIHGIDKLENESGSMIERWTLYPSTHRAKDVLYDILIDYDASPEGLWPDRSKLLACFEEGLPVINEEKLTQTYASFAEELPATFSEIFHRTSPDSSGVYRIKADDAGSCFFYQNHKQDWQQVGFIDGVQFYILRVTRYMNDEEWQMSYDVYNDKWEMQCQFQTAPEDHYTSTLAVKKRFRDALQALRGQRMPGARLLDILRAGEDHPEVRQIVRLPDLYVPTGSIVATDPLANMARPAFSRRTPVGMFPVNLYIEQQYGWICCAEIRFSDDEIAAWEMAVLPGQKLEELIAGEIYGYPVDAGLGCFMDEESAQRFREHQQQLTEQLGEAYDNYYDDYLSELLEGDEAVSSDYCNAVPYPGQPHNAAVFRSGWGDGFYASYFALNEKGEVVRLITDFACLGE